MSIWKDRAYTAFLTVPSFNVGITILSYPINAIAVVIRPPYGGKKPLYCASNASGDDLFPMFLPFSKKKEILTFFLSLLSKRWFRGDLCYNASSLLKCTVQLSMKQQIHSLQVFLLRRRPASSAVSSPSFPFLMTDVSVVKGRSPVLQAEPKSLQILPEDRDFFPFFFSPNIYLLS